MNRETLQKWMRFIFHKFTRLEFIHPEYIPSQGGVLIATNHLSRLDIPVLFLIPTRPDITALVTDKYQSHPFFRWFVDTAKGIWIDRTKADFTAFREAISVLRRGGCVGISPEGTRSKTGELLEGKAGTVLLALKADVPIVPVGLSGTEKALQGIVTFQYPTVTAKFGPPIRLEPLKKESHQEMLKRYTDEIMCRIAVLLPERNRGYYRNHPRLKELLESGGNEA